MLSAHDEEVLNQCFHDVTGSSPARITALNTGASQRRRYRVEGSGTTLIGVVNPHPPENEAFVYFARLFSSVGLPVPHIACYRPDLCAYLEDDMGDTSLADLLRSERAQAPNSAELPHKAFHVYRLAIEFLPLFQVRAAERIDFTRCYPARELLHLTVKNDRMMFTQDFAQRLLPSCDTSALFEDFQTLNGFLIKAPAQYFVYRDFCAGNIMVRQHRPYFIDFQSGCRGALQYDVASLLCESTTAIPNTDHVELVEHYLDTLRHYATIDRNDFLQLYSSFVISRMLHLLGVFGNTVLSTASDLQHESILRILTLLARELQSSYAPIRLPTITAYLPHFEEALTRWQTNPEQSQRKHTKMPQSW